MAYVTWTMRLYDIHGNAITAASYDPATYSSSNIIRHAFGRSLSFTLNSIDELEFQLYLDDPMALKIFRGRCVVKVYRDIVDDDHTKYLTSDVNEPIFCGVVQATTKNGSANTMRVKCMSPLWRLQTHFHILNHYLETNPDTDDIYSQSELIWKLIDLVNGAFGGDSFTGIAKGDFLWGALSGEPQIGPYFVGEGTNTWSNIFDDIMVRPSSPDLIPRYTHTSSDHTLMYLDTDRKRGFDISASLGFNYHTGTNDNCDDLSEEDQIIPGDWGNYLWVVGAGGPNSGKLAARTNSSSSAESDGTGEIGVYMLRIDRDEVKRVPALGHIADAELAKRQHPIKTYTVQVSPVSGTYYTADYSVGDVIELNANRGALVVSGVNQRIYQSTLTMSENNLETVDNLIAHDFYGKVDGT